MFRTWILRSSLLFVLLLLFLAASSLPPRCWFCLLLFSYLSPSLISLTSLLLTPPLSLTSLPHLFPSSLSLTQSPDGCRRTGPVPPLHHSGSCCSVWEAPSLISGGGSRSGRLVPSRVAWHLLLPSALCLPEPGAFQHSWISEVVMGRRPADAFRTHRRDRTCQHPVKQTVSCCRKESSDDRPFQTHSTCQQKHTTTVIKSVPHLVDVTKPFSGKASPPPSADGLGWDLPVTDCSEWETG